MGGGGRSVEHYGWAVFVSFLPKVRIMNRRHRHTPAAFAGGRSGGGRRCCGLEEDRRGAIQGGRRPERPHYATGICRDRRVGSRLSLVPGHCCDRRGGFINAGLGSSRLTPLPWLRTRAYAVDLCRTQMGEIPMGFSHCAHILNVSVNVSGSRVDSKCWDRRGGL